MAWCRCRRPIARITSARTSPCSISSSRSRTWPRSMHSTNIFLRWRSWTTSHETPHMNVAVRRLSLADDWYGGAQLHLGADSRLILPSGNEMPVIGLGTYQLKHQTVDSVACALQRGYRMI